MVVHLGRLGVLTRVDARRRAALRGHAARLRRPELGRAARALRRVFAAAYSVSVFTRWDEASTRCGSRAATRRRRRCSTRRRPTVERHPIIELDPVNCTAQLGRPGPWWDRLPHFRMGFTPQPRRRAAGRVPVAARARRGGRSRRCARCTGAAAPARERAAHGHRRHAVDEPDATAATRSASTSRSSGCRSTACCASSKRRSRPFDARPHPGQAASHARRLRARGRLRSARRAAGPARRVQLSRGGSASSTSGDSGGGSSCTYSSTTEMMPASGHGEEDADDPAEDAARRERDRRSPPGAG